MDHFEKNFERLRSSETGRHSKFQRIHVSLKFLLIKLPSQVIEPKQTLNLP